MNQDWPVTRRANLCLPDQARATGTDDALGSADHAGSAEPAVSVDAGSAPSLSVSPNTAST